MAGAKQMGLAIKDAIGSALFETTPRAARQYRAVSGGTVTRNLYGHFLIVEKPDGMLDICRDPERYTFPKGCTVYIVADLVGMPIARLQGSVRPTSMSVGNAPGFASDGEYLIDLWLDPGDGNGHELSDDARERLGRFLVNVLGGRDSLTVEELVQVTQARMTPFLNAMLDVPSPGKSWIMGQQLPDQAAMLAQAIQDFQAKASEYFGLTLSVRFRPGVKYFPHSILLNEASRAAAQTYAVANWELVEEDGQWLCANADCGIINSRTEKFCASCGGARPAATTELRSDTKWKLVTKDGHDLDLEIAFVSFGQEAVDADGITAACIDALRIECRRVTADELNDPVVLDRFNLALNNTLTSGRFGLIGEFRVVYFSTAEEEWKRQMAAQLRQDLRAIESTSQRLVLTDEALSLRELQLLRDRRETDVWQQELSARLDRARVEAGNQLAQEELEATTNVERDKLKNRTELDRDANAIQTGLERDKLKIQANLEASRAATEAAGKEMRFTREIEQQGKAYAREDAVQESAERRLDDMAELDHDLQKEDKVDAARRKAEQDAAELKARIDRLKASTTLDAARQTQDLELDRKRAEQDIDITAASVKSKLEIEKLKAMAEMEALQREQQSKMSAAQLLALQASSLAEKGAMDAITQLASQDGKTAEASAEAKVAKMQAEMLERMMAMQSQSQSMQADASKEAMQQQMQLMMMAMQQQQSTSNAAMLANQEAIKAAMLGQHAANSRLQDAQQQTADAAMAWNTRSIDAMSQVAATKAGNPGSPSPASVPSTAPYSGGGAARFCPSCGVGATGTAKFCTDCGHKFTA